MYSTGPAEQPRAYVLSTPWSLFDRTDALDQTGRRLLSLDNPVEVPAGRPLFLAAPERVRVDIDGQRLGAHRETLAFDLVHRRYALYSLSIGTREEDAILSVRLDNEVAGKILIQGHLPRPNWSLGREGSAPNDERQERLDLYLLGLVDLIRLVDDPAVAWHESGWERLMLAWTGDEISLTDPPMALIVRHAKSLQRLLIDLGRHPRRILRRTQDMTPVDRVQELDIASIRWLSRQPGREIYDRAGPRQRILAVRRFQDLDTLENRVLRDLAARSYGLTSAYIKRYRNLKISRRWQQVAKYRRTCQRLARNSRDRDIRMPHTPIVPNYVLLQNLRYRRIWSAYREIIRHIDEQDEWWRWQHRLWVDFCRLATQVALHSRFLVIAESPLRIAAEQQRGQWSLVDAHSGSYLLNDRQEQPVAVISVLWDVTAEHPKLASWMAGLGVAAVLHLQRLEDGLESYLLLWPLHVFGEDIPSLNDIAASAQRALETCLSTLALADDVDIKAEGLVLVSHYDARQGVADPTPERVGNVAAVRFSASLRQDIDHLSNWLHSMALRLVEHTEVE